MKFVQTGEGFVDRRSRRDEQRPLASGPRFARVGDELLCSYMVQSKLGVNDFVPVLARSRDGGHTWTRGQPMWPQHEASFSIFGAISAGPLDDGRLLYVGSRYVIDQPGEPNWSEATGGLKQNQMFWAHSTDGTAGRAWAEPRLIPMPISGAAEATCPICVTSTGRWLAAYSPYNTFDPALEVDRGQVVVLGSDDDGATWWHRSMLRFDEPGSGGAEAWVIELSDGRLLGTAWHTDLSGGGRNYANAYALSQDGGQSWSPTRGTGIMGQSTWLTPLPDGQALFLHTQRGSTADVGVWAAVVEPTAGDFGIRCHVPVWRAAGGPGATTHENWRHFTFGEPAATLLHYGGILLAFWYADPDEGGIGLVRLRIDG